MSVAELDALAARAAAALSTGAISPRYALAVAVPALIAEVRGLRCLDAWEKR
jgi:hypothetical protein